jgi:hypothetical protein
MPCTNNNFKLFCQEELNPIKTNIGVFSRLYGIEAVKKMTC